MKMTVRPGKRPGFSKPLFNQNLSRNDIEVKEAGEVTFTFVGADIYTLKATQRFSITLTQEEVKMVKEAICMD